MSTLAERLRLVMTTKELSGRRWSEQAGFSSRIVSTVLHRIDAGTVVAMRRGTTDALALAAGVDPEWLATGHGVPPSADLDGYTGPKGPRRPVATDAVGHVLLTALTQGSLAGLDCKAAAAWVRSRLARSEAAS